MMLYRRLCPGPDRATGVEGGQSEWVFGIENPVCATMHLQVRREERKRIAQELHDTLLQGFTGIALKLDALASSLPPALSKTKDSLEHTLEEIDYYLREARRSVLNLRSPALENAEDFPAALRKASERVLEGTGVELGFSVRGAKRNIDNIAQENLLRICEEALANAVKHARPTRAEVTVEFKANEFELVIRDNGCGFETNRPEGSKWGHFGLIGMQERAEALLGSFLIDSAPQRGTHVTVIIPTDGIEHQNTARIPATRWVAKPVSIAA